MTVGVTRVNACTPHTPRFEWAPCRALFSAGPLQAPILGPHAPRGPNGPALMGSLKGPILWPHAPRGPNGPALMSFLQGLILGTHAPRVSHGPDVGPNACRHNISGDPCWILQAMRNSFAFLSMLRIPAACRTNFRISDPYPRGPRPCVVACALRLFPLLLLKGTQLVCCQKSAHLLYSAGSLVGVLPTIVSIHIQYI